MGPRTNALLHTCALLGSSSGCYYVENCVFYADAPHCTLADSSTNGDSTSDDTTSAESSDTSAADSTSTFASESSADSTDETGEALDPPSGFGVAFAQVKTLEFSWDPNPRAAYHTLWWRRDAESELMQVGTNILSSEVIIQAPLHLRWNSTFVLRACSAMDTCVDSEPLDIGTQLPDLATAIGYFKSSNTDAQDAFGTSVALSGDGDTLAVGVPHEDSASDGIMSNDSDNSAESAGAVFIFERSNSGTWMQTSYIKAMDSTAGDEFGTSVALSHDGQTLVVGAPGADGPGNQVPDSGSVYVFRSQQGTWGQQQVIDAPNAGMDDAFGRSIAVSDDGNTLAVGAWGEDSTNAALPNDNGAESSGAVYVWTQAADVWSQQSYIKSSIPTPLAFFGTSVSLSDGPGDTLVIGAYGENTESGAVHVSTRSQSTWQTPTRITPLDADPSDYMGWSVAVSSDGNRVFAGAYGDDGTDDTSPTTGAVHVFARNGDAWISEEIIRSEQQLTNSRFGRSLALNSAGDLLVVGANTEPSAAVGIGGDQSSASALQAGATFVFERLASTWEQVAYVKASNPNAGDQFGGSVSLSSDGETLVVGAPSEDSGSVGISSFQLDNASEAAGAVYVY